MMRPIRTLRLMGRPIETGLTDTELVLRSASASVPIKYTTAVCNNAAWAALLEAHDHIKADKRYKNMTKRAFRRVFAELKEYENKLIFSSDLYNLDSLSPTLRALYAPKLTTREYYDFLASTGMSAYSRLRPWTINLWNKYKNALAKRKRPHAETDAWALAGNACAKVAEAGYKAIISKSSEELSLPINLLEAMFSPMNFAPVADAWERAVDAFLPDIEEEKIDRLEEDNLQMALDQMQERWYHPTTIAEELHRAIDEYTEIFASEEARQRVKELVTIRVK